MKYVLNFKNQKAYFAKSDKRVDLNTFLVGEDFIEADFGSGKAQYFLKQEEEFYFLCSKKLSKDCVQLTK